MERIKIKLTEEERMELERYIKTGVHSVHLVKRARIILALDTAKGRKASTQETIAKQVEVSRQTVNVVKKDYLAAESVGSFLQRKKRETPPVAPKVTGELEAHVVALACGEAPEGRTKWTMQLIADK